MTYPQDPYDRQPGYEQQPGYGQQQPMYGGHPQQPPGHGYAVPPMGAPQPQPGAPTARDYSDASIAHYLGIIGWIGPLIYYFVSADGSPYVKQHARTALNFHLSFIIYYLGGVFISVIVGVLLGVVAGVWLLIPLILLLTIVGFLSWSIFSSIKGGTMAKRGELYTYRGSFNFIKR